MQVWCGLRASQPVTFLLSIALFSAVVVAKSQHDQSCSPTAREKLVRFDAVITDDSGRPVTDLQATEFRLLDKGKPQKIAFLRRSEQPNSAQRLTVLLFDELNADIQVNDSAWKQMVGALQRFASDETFYLYLLTDEGVLYPIHGLPEEGSIPSGSNKNWMEEALPQFEGMARRIYGLKPLHGAGGQALVTWTAVSEIASILKGVPGRKNLLWIGNGAPFLVHMTIERKNANPAVQETAEQMQRFLEKLQEARLAVYMVGGNGPAKAAISDENRIIPLLPNLEALDELPGLTGGRAWVDAKIDEAMAQAINDERASCQIGYYPAPENWDGRFHKLRLRCTRPGVRVNAENGYFANACGT